MKDSASSDFMSMRERASSMRPAKKKRNKERNVQVVVLMSLVVTVEKCAAFTARSLTKVECGTVRVGLKFHGSVDIERSIDFALS